MCRSNVVEKACGVDDELGGVDDELGGVNYSKVAKHVVTAGFRVFGFLGIQSPP